MPLTSQFPDAVIPQVDLWTFLFEREPNGPVGFDRELFTDANTSRSYTHAQIKARSIDFGQGLKSLWKWKKGDVLGFFSPNNIDTAVITTGVLWAGGICSPANPLYTADELAFQLKDSGAKGLVTQVPMLPVARQAAKKAGIPEERIILMGDGKDPAGKASHFSEISGRDAWIKPGKTAVGVNDLAFLVYSSGTTGLPKGVMLTHRNIVSNISQQNSFDIGILQPGRDRQLAVLPFFHIYGLTIILLTTLRTDVPVIVMPKFDLPQACQLIQKRRITFLYVPPPIVLALAKAPIVSDYDLSSLRFLSSGAAPLGQELVTAVWNRLRTPVKQGYGLSETSPLSHAQTVDEFWKFVGSVGKLAPSMQAKIVDPDGKEVKQGDHGEILLRGPNVFGGYHNKPELNAQNFTEDGFFKTGDIGYIDANHNFYITDRVKELIKFNGFQVPPAELEALLLGREDITDACVIGVWDAQRQTEVPRAYVVMRPDVTCSDDLAKEVAEWVAARVTPHKRLRGGVRFVKEVPKSAAGKILRRILKEQAKKEAEGDKQPVAKL